MRGARRDRIPAVVVALAILLLALGLRLYRLDAQDIWWDEARNLDVAGRPLASIAWAPELDIHPPLYFYVLHFWLHWAGRSEFAVRFLSVAFGLLLVPLVGQVGRHLAGKRAGLLAMGVAAVAPMWVAECQETRMYTLTLVFLCLGLYALTRAVADPGRWGPAWWWAVWGASSGAAMLTHYSALFVLAAENAFVGLLWLLGTPWRNRGQGLRRLGRWAGSQVLGFLLFLPQVPRALAQILPYRNPALRPPTWGQYVADTWQAFLFGVNVGRQAVAWGMAAAACILVLGLAAWGWILRRREQEGQRGGQFRLAALLGAVFVLPWCVYFLTLQDRGTFHPRYIMFVTPALYVLLAVALEGLWRVRRALGAGALALWLIPASVGLWSDYWNPAYFREEASGVARYVAQHASARDVVLFDVPYPFPYYYRGEAPGHYLFVDINTVDQRLTELCQGRERVFWVTWYKSDTDPRGAVTYLLEKHGALEEERDFRGYHLAVYRLAGPATFRLAEGWQEADGRFGGVVRLAAFAYGQAPPARGRAGLLVWVALRWERLGPTQAWLKASVRLVAEGDRKLAQDDRPLINDRHLHTDGWQPGDRPLNVYLLRPEGEVPPGVYRVQVVVYDEATLEPLPLLDAQGNPAGQVLDLGPISLGRPGMQRE